MLRVERRQTKENKVMFNFEKLEVWNRAIEFADAFAIITTIEPIRATSELAFTLKLPVPINPAQLWYALFEVSEQELESQDSTYGSYQWNPDYETQTVQGQTDLPLLAEQELSFILEPRIYVLEVHAGWGSAPPHTELEANYGFLLEVQE